MLLLGYRDVPSLSLQPAEVVIRAAGPWAHPALPCAGTVKRFESRPDIPEEMAAQTTHSSQSATNSRRAAKNSPLDGEELESCVCVCVHTRQKNFVPSGNNVSVAEKSIFEWRYFQLHYSNRVLQYHVCQYKLFHNF